MDIKNNFTNYLLNNSKSKGLPSNWPNFFWVNVKSFDQLKNRLPYYSHVPVTAIIENDSTSKIGLEVIS